MKNACPACGQAVPEPCGLVVDYDRNEVRFAGLSIAITAKHFRILDALVKAQGRAVSKESLFQACYFDQPYGDDVEIKIIDVFVCKLRKSLKPLVPFGIEIITHWGRGYEFKAPGLQSRETGIPLTAGDVAGLTYGGR